MSGLLTNGYPAATFASLAAASVGNLGRVPVDTQAAQGAAPQSAYLTTGQLGSLIALTAAITAFAGGGQASATQLNYGASVVTVVATAADSVKLPPAFPGAICFVKNADGADSMTVFGFGTDTIDGVASATGNAQAAGKGKLYYGVTGAGDGVAGTWVSLLGA